MAPHLVEGDRIIDSCQVRLGVYVGRTLLPAGHLDIKVRMVNTSSKPQRLTNGTCLGNVSPVEVIGGANDDPGGSPAVVSGAHPLTEPAMTQPLLD